MEYENYSADLEYLRELEQSFALTNTSFMEARGHWDRKLMANIVELSVADNYDDARLEWRATGRVFKRSRNTVMNERLEEMAEEWGHPVGHCICGHSVVYHYEIENTINNRITVLGSDHIENYHIARRIMADSNLHPARIGDSNVKTWRKDSETEMSYREYQASEEYVKHNKRVNLLSEIDNRFNSEYFHYDLKNYSLARPQDINSLSDLFDLDAMVENSLSDLLTVNSNSRFKKTPSRFSSEHIFAFSSIQYRNQKAERARRKPPASLLADMSSMIAQRREANEIIDEEKDFIIESLKLNFLVDMVFKYSNFLSSSRSNLQSNADSASYRKEEILKTKDETLERIKGFSNRELLDSLSDEDKLELADYGVLKLLEEREDDFMYYESLSSIFTEDTSTLFAGRRLLKPETIDLGSLEEEIEKIDSIIEDYDATIALSSKLELFPTSDECSAFQSWAYQQYSQFRNVNSYLYRLCQVNSYHWRRYIRGETEMLKDEQKEMYRLMGNELANVREVMTRFRLRHSQARYESLLTRTRELSNAITNQINLEDYFNEKPEVMIPNDYQEIVLNLFRTIKPSVEGLNTEQNIQEVN